MISAVLAHLDRRVSTGDTGFLVAYNAGTNTTTWTMPFSIPTDNSEGTVCVVLTDTGEVLSGTTRPSGTTVAITGEGNLTARPVAVGVLYPATFAPTIPYLRGNDGAAVLTGEVLLHHCTVFATESVQLTAQVDRKGRSTRTLTKSVANGLAGLHVPIHARRSDTSLVIGDTSPYPFALTGLTWTGEFFTKARRV